MSDIFKCKIKNKKLYLIKPSFWTMGIIDNISDKFQLKNKKFIIDILYYTQVDLKKIDKEYISCEDTKILNEIYLKYINSDTTFLKTNNYDSIDNIKMACKILKKFIYDTVASMNSKLYGMIFIIKMMDSWIKSLNGEMNLKSIKELDIGSKSILTIYTQNPEYFEGIEFFISDLKNFRENKEDYKIFCSKLNTIVKKTKELNLWIPSIWSEEIFNNLLILELSELNSSTIKDTIFKYINSVEGNYLFEKIIQCELFSGREQILEEAFEAFRLKLYAPAITCFLPQLDYLILQIACNVDIPNLPRNVNRTVIKELSEYVREEVVSKIKCSYFIDITNIGKVSFYFQLFSLTNFLDKISFADTKKIKTDDKLNRHGILHGKFLNYSNFENAIITILLIYEFVILYEKIINDNNKSG